MPRSTRKGPYVPSHLQKKVDALHANSAGGKKSVLKVWARNSMIIPQMVGLTISVHNGKIFIPVYLTENMVGRKLGEFAPTRTFKGHAGDRKVKGGKAAKGKDGKGGKAKS